MSLVIDASVALGWYFEDEHVPGLDPLLDRVTEAGAVVPGLWRLEIANGLQMAVRRKRIDHAYRDTALTQLARLPITIDGDTAAHAWTETLRLADRFGLTLYDAAYLELALRRELPMATLDSLLAGAARTLGVSVLPGTGDQA